MKSTPLLFRDEITNWPYLVYILKYQKTDKAGIIWENLCQETKNHILNHEIYSKSLLAENEVMNWDAIVRLFREHQTPVMERLWNFTSVEAKQAMMEWSKTSPLTRENKMIILNTINKMLTDKDFYDEKTFGGFKLDTEGSKLVKMDKNELNIVQLQRMNRLVFDSFFENIIKPCGRYNPPGDELQLAVIADLNSMIESGVFNSSGFKSGVKLRGKTQEVMQTEPDNTILVNRLILQDTFPEDIAINKDLWVNYRLPEKFFN